MNNYHTLRSILPKSAYATIGHISNENDLKTLEAFIKFNAPFLVKFPIHIIAQNAVTPELKDKANNLWKQYYPQCVIIDHNENKGHTFGTLELDNSIFEYTLQHKSKIKYVWKCGNDVIMDSSIFDVTVENADLYFLNNIGYNAFTQENGDFKALFNKVKLKTYFYPQTWFFILKNDFDYLNSKELIKDGYEKWKLTPEKKPWEVYEGIDCETQLKECVKRNKLTTYHLLDEVSLERLLNAIGHYQIHDGSHKNLVYTKLGNLCHYQYTDKTVLPI